MFESLPDALAFSTMIVTGGGIAITGICKMKSPKSNGFMPKSLCDERSGAIQDDIKEIKDMQQRIFDKIDKLR
ncbi:MAG: hypothetical protein JRE23_02665 [Deltaproteobacteria bacterium]|nr:hypothetical protein [Deltaproteobacteria bacterium]